MNRILSISTAAFDGYDLAIAVREISQLGVDAVELAFIKGYTEDFGEDIFSSAYAKELQNLISSANLSCFAFSSHMNLVTREDAEIFKKRMDFARQVGARIIISGAGPRQGLKGFMHNMEELARVAESLEIIIGLENSGDGKESIINAGRDGASVVKQIDSKWIRLNYDFGNLISHHSEKVRPEEDYRYALPLAAHLHIKDVQSFDQGWYFTEIGKGMIDYQSILSRLKIEAQTLPLSLEIPLRFYRARDASPQRAASPVPLEEIRRTLRGSLDFIRGILES
jgi:sugar phosphate isomerase/epimerase